MHIERPHKLPRHTWGSTSSMEPRKGTDLQGLANILNHLRVNHSAKLSNFMSTFENGLNSVDLRKVFRISISLAPRFVTV